MPGALKPGDIIVTNFGAMNTGTTLVRFPAGKGPGLLFNTMATPTMGAEKVVNRSMSSGTDD